MSRSRCSAVVEAMANVSAILLPRDFDDNEDNDDD